MSTKAPSLTVQHGSTPVAPSHAPTAASIANRQTMPTVADVIDQLRLVFGPVKVVFAEEAGHELGKRPDPGVIAYPPHVPNNKRKTRTEGRSTPAARASHDVTTMVKR